MSIFEVGDTRKKLRSFPFQASIRLKRLLEGRLMCNLARNAGLEERQPRQKGRAEPPS